MSHIKNFLVTLIVFIVLDVLWLNFTISGIYRDKIGGILAAKVNYGAASLFYIVFVIGLVYFVVEPAIAAGDIKKAAFSGAIFGLVTYGTFDLTNQAMIKDWSWFITMIDICWGMFIGASSSALSLWVIKKML